ncbi:MAG: hypothetical protein Q8N42_00970 [bacterium]|nr:hypothetical protein [bacterium]
MAEKEIGKVTHFFDKISVMVIKLTDKLAVGDTIKIKHGDEEFEEKVESMQVEHENISKAKKGDEIAIKVSSPTKEGAAVYKVE